MDYGHNNQQQDFYQEQTLTLEQLKYQFQKRIFRLNMKESDVLKALQFRRDILIKCQKLLPFFCQNGLKVHPLKTLQTTFRPYG